MTELTVIGKGVYEYLPDSLNVHMTLEVTKSTMNEAVAELTKRHQKIIEAHQSLKLPTPKLLTATVDKHYGWPRGKMKLLGYQARQILVTSLRSDITKLYLVVEKIAATRTGSQIRIAFESNETDKAEIAAQKNALIHARALAESAAVELSLKLHSVKSVAPATFQDQSLRRPNLRWLDSLSVSSCRSTQSAEPKTITATSNLEVIWLCQQSANRRPKLR